MRRSLPRLEGRAALYAAVAAAAAVLLLVGATRAWGVGKGEKHTRIRVLEPARNVIGNSGFDDHARGWAQLGAARVLRVETEAKVGRASLRVTATERTRSAGAQSFIPAAGKGRRFTASAWVKGRGSAVGKKVRLQLDEVGGDAPERVLGGTAAARVKLNGKWQRVVTSGSVAREDRTNLLGLVLLEDAAEGETFYVDEYRVRTQEIAATSVSSRWRWWVYAVLWIGVALVAVLVRQALRPVTRGDAAR